MACNDLRQSHVWWHLSLETEGGHFNKKKYMYARIESMCSRESSNKGYIFNYNGPLKEAFLFCFVSHINVYVLNKINK